MAHQKGFVSRKFLNRTDGGLGEEWSLGSLCHSLTAVWAMSNPLPRKRLKEKVTDIRLGFKKYTFILVCFWVETVNHLFPKVTEWFPFCSWFWTQHCVFFLGLLQSVDLVNKWWTSKALELGLHEVAEPENLNLWNQQDCSGKLTSLLRRFLQHGLYPGIASGKKHKEDTSEPLKWPSDGEITKIGESSRRRSMCSLHYYFFPRWDPTGYCSPLWMWKEKQIWGP